MMANNVTMRVEGLQQLGQNIRTMNNKVATKLIRSAVVAGAKVIVNATKAGAPVDTGALKKSIGSRRDIINSRVGYETRAVSIFRVKGIFVDNASNRQKGRVGKKYLQDGPTFYWKFNELGTVRQPAKPFLQPALSGNIQAVIDAVANRLKQGIAEEFK